MNKIPLYGVGTYLLEGPQCIEIVKHALQRGVRLIDTAHMYGNEAEVGQAISESGVPRSEIFLITKMNVAANTPDLVRQSVKESLAKLKTDYVDLFLIHTPRNIDIVETWRTLLAEKERGHLREVGVSNFGPQHCEKLAAAGLPYPSVNEFEIHLWNQMEEMVEQFNKKHVKLIGYCPLARGQCFGKNTVSQEIAQELGISEAILALRWSISKGYVTIPKTSNIARLDEMIDKVMLQPPLSQDIMKRLEKANMNHFASRAVQAMFETA